MTRWRCWTSRLGVAVVAAGLVGVACTPPGGPGPDPTEPPTDGGIFMYASASDVVGLDPVHNDDAASTRVDRQIFEGLTLPSDDGTKATPGVASSWHTTDHRTWDFTIRPGVTFHDGESVTAASVCANVDRWRSLAGEELARAHTWRTLFTHDGTPMLSCTRVDDHLARLELTRALPNLPELLSLPAFAIQSPESFADPENPVGTGPFRFLSREPGVRLVLGRNEDYWGQVSIIDKAVIQVVPDARDRTSGLVDGRFHAFDTLPPADVGADDLPVIEGTDRHRPTVLYLGINQRDPALSDRRVRKALALTIDRTALRGRALPRGTLPAHGLIPPPLTGSSQPEATPPDRAWARELLSQAGYDEQHPLELTIAYPSGIALDFLPAPEETYLAIAEQLEQVHVAVQPVALPWQTYLQELNHPTHRADLHLMGWAADIFDTDTLLTPLFGAPNAQFGFRQPLIHQAINEARSRVDPTEAYRAVEDELAEFLPLVPLAHPQSRLWLSEAVHDYPVSPVAAERWNTLRVD